MNIVYLSFKSLLAKPLSSLLSWMLLTFGVTIIVLILLIGNQLKDEITKNSAGIDLVIGAKGSPLQLILANVFHVDFPTGNIGLKEAAKVSKNRYIASAIPLSLGDSYQGFRVVGTTPAYAGLYAGKLREGEWFAASMEVVLGSEVARKLGLAIGATFQSQHGLSDDGDSHEGHPFIVRGILEDTHTVLDKLILTSIQSVWEVHGHEEEEHEEHHEGHHEAMDSLVEIRHLGVAVTSEQLEEEEITALLVQYRSPMGAVMLPRAINAESNFQAASPAFETARLFNIIGVGVQVLNLLGILIMVISAISVFIALLNSLKDRKYDIAIMRSMGATRSQIFVHVLVEGLLITFVGGISGLVIAHGMVYALVSFLEGVNPQVFHFLKEEWLVIVGCFLIGLLASVVPAIVAFKTDISKTLSKG